MSDKFQSQALASGNMIRLLDLAIRGMPRHFMPTEQRVDLAWAQQVYWPELRQLDELGIHSRWYWSGITAAALISLVVWPQTKELWHRYTNRLVYRDDAGVDAPGLLYEMVERHRGDERLTRRAAYQLYVFQTALAVARAWAHNAPEHRYSHRPPVPNVPELIDRVRRHKAQRHRATGFRPLACLRAYYQVPTAPEQQHHHDPEATLALAQEANHLNDQPADPSRFGEVLSWIYEQRPDPALCHPAALAAAVVTIANDDRTRVVWQQVLKGSGIRHPQDGKAAVDTPMMIVDCIYAANRNRDPARGALYLYCQITRTLTYWAADPDRMIKKAPNVPSDWLDNCGLWQAQRVSFAPTMSFADTDPIPDLTPAVDSARGANPGTRSPDLSGAANAQRMKTGRTAEDWFAEHYRQIMPPCQSPRLIDQRDSSRGYDYEIQHADGQWHVEVKGVRGRQGRLRLTDAQWARARLEGENYFLVVVMIDGDKPEPICIRNPAAHLDPEKRERHETVVEWVLDSALLPCDQLK